MPKTRKDFNCPVFGSPEMLKGNALPTYADIIKYYMWVRNDLLSLSNGKDPGIGDICDIVASDVEKLWARASISVISRQQIIHRIKEYYKKLKGLKKCRKPEQKLEFFENAKRNLFDIAICKCFDFSLCKCPIKVPVNEREFLQDQRNQRKLIIAGIDLKASKQLQQRLDRKEKLLIRKSETSQYNAEIHTSPSPSSDVENCDFQDFEVKNAPFLCNIQKKTQPSTSKSSSSQMRLPLTRLATACDRTGISDRSASIIATAVLQDLGIVTEEDPSKVIDRSKLRRERQKNRFDLRKLSVSGDLQGLYFDGRKDKTLKQEKIGDKLHRKTVIEEHIVLVSEPGMQYLGHVTPSSGSAERIQKSIMHFLNTKVSDFSKLIAIGCDGTVVNTGLKNGVIAQIEVKLGRPLQWFICLLHANELPLRHLFKFIDGSTSGPSNYIGSIGKLLETCEKLPVTRFEKIKTE